MALWRDPERGDWRYEFQFRKVRHVKCGFTSKAEALAAREAARAELKAGKSKRPATPIQDMITQYLTFCEKRHPPKEFKYKTLVFNRFLDYLGPHGKERPVSDITPVDITGFLNTRPTNVNYNKHLARLKSLYTYGVNVLRLLDPPDNPCLFLKELPHESARGYIPSETEILRIIMVSDPITERPLIVTALLSWGRIDELLRLKWRDINLESRELTLRCRKNQAGVYRERKVWMNDTLFETMKRLWSARGQNTWVFFNPKTRTRYTARPRLMASIIRRANETGDKIPHFGWHALRRFGATYAKDRLKAESKTVQGILGHSALSTTERYLGSIPASQEEVMRGMEGLFDDAAAERNHGDEGAATKPRCGSGRAWGYPS